MNAITYYCTATYENIQNNRAMTSLAFHQKQQAFDWGTRAVTAQE